MILGAEPLIFKPVAPGSYPTTTPRTVSLQTFRDAQSSAEGRKRIMKVALPALGVALGLGLAVGLMK